MAKKILVIDDQQSVHDLANEFRNLYRLDVEVVSALNLVEGLERAAHSSEKFVAVFLDGQFPKGETVSSEYVKTMKQLCGEDVPIFPIAGNQDLASVMINAGCENEVLEKISIIHQARILMAT